MVEEGERVMSMEEAERQAKMAGGEKTRQEAERQAHFAGEEKARGEGERESKIVELKKAKEGAERQEQLVGEANARAGEQQARIAEVEKVATSMEQNLKIPASVARFQDNAAPSTPKAVAKLGAIGTAAMNEEESYGNLSADAFEPEDTPGYNEDTPGYTETAGSSPERSPRSQRFGEPLEERDKYDSSFETDDSVTG